MVGTLPPGGDGRAHVLSRANGLHTELAPSKSGRLCNATVLPGKNASQRIQNTPQRIHDTAYGSGLPICWTWLKPLDRTLRRGCFIALCSDLICNPACPCCTIILHANPGEWGKTDSGLGSAGLVLSDLRFISRTPLISGISLQKTIVFRVWPGRKVRERRTYGANYRAVVCQTNSQASP